MINTIKEDELGIIILCFSCLHSQNIQLQNIQFSFICLKLFDSSLQRLCVLQYHAHVTFIRQSWIHFNLVSVSDAAFNLRFLRWWKCISFKWLVELKKKKNWVGGSDKHPDQPASPDSIQDLTSCYTEKQSFGGETACQRARQLRERATHQLPDH